jgi:CRISPR type III-A-associated RAMP protein Csm5
MYERYKLEITTLSPIHIGDGGRLTPLDYMKRGNAIHVVDEDRLFEELERRRLVERFINYVERAGEASLEGFLRDAGLEVSERISRYSVEVFSSIKSKEVSTLIKDMYGRAYIPGSEIKGAVRLALLHSILEKEPAKKSLIVDILRRNLPDGDGLMRPRVHEPQGDLGRLIRFSDSNPVDRIAIAQAYRVSTRLPNPVPLTLVETVPHNISVEAVLTLVSSRRIVGEIGGSVSIQEIVESCRRKAEKVIGLEERRIRKMIQGASTHPAWIMLDEFYRRLLEELKQCRGLEAVLRVGGGQGLYSTTLLSALIDDEGFRDVVRTGRGGRIERLKKLLLSDSMIGDKPYNVKVVDVNGRFMPLGWVKVVFREA